MGLSAYAGGYWAIRRAEVLTFEYPTDFLDGHLGIKNTNPTLTRNNSNSFDPVAEVKGWSVIPLPIGGNDTWPEQRLVRFFSLAIALEAKFKKNTVTDDHEHISGRLSGHTCGAALRALLKRDSGIDYPSLAYGTGKYWHDFADGWGVSLDGALIEIDSAELIRCLRENSAYTVKEVKSEEDFRLYGGGLGFTKLPVYHFAHQSNDDEHGQSWLIIVHDYMVTIRYRNPYTDA